MIIKNLIYEKWYRVKKLNYWVSSLRGFQSKKMLYLYSQYGDDLFCGISSDLKLNKYLKCT